MDYIYDILLNFSREYFDFFEWVSKDNIINVRKVPCFRLSDQDYLKFKYDSITVEEDFLDKIHNKTCLYSGNNNCPYVCLFTNSIDVFGAMFNKQGNLIKRSSLLLDEAYEVLEESFSYNVTNINIIKYKKSCNLIISRLERERKAKIRKFLFKSMPSDNQLKYIYYDYFGMEEGNSDKILKSLVNEVNNPWNKKLNKLYELISMMGKIKN